MIISDLVHSEDLRNRLMDVIKCTNDEYQSIIEKASPHEVTKDGLRDSEDFIRLRLYSPGEAAGKHVEVRSFLDKASIGPGKRISNTCGFIARHELSGALLHPRDKTKRLDDRTFAVRRRGRKESQENEPENQSSSESNDSTV